MPVLATLSGCGRAETAAPAPDGHTRMLQVLQRIRDRTLDEHPYMGDAQLRHAQSVLETLPDGAPPLARFQVLRTMAYHEARLGRLEQSTATFESAYELWPRVRAELSREERDLFLLHAAAACLRLGELQNCIHCQTGESCILPLKGAAVHSRPEGTLRSIEYLKLLLEENPDHLVARWLLNVALMAVGEYPDAVPERFRVAPEKFQSLAEFPRFTNIARELEIDEVSLLGGTAVEDFDNDGFLDIFTTTWDPAGDAILFRNLGNGRFERRIDKAGLRGISGGSNAVHADYDNDGDVDVLVLRGAWLADAGRHPNSLLQNDGTGRFRDVTYDVGLAAARSPSQTAAWADFNNDGHLDLYVGSEGGPSQLFAGDGRGRFVDVTGIAGVANERFAKGVVWGDYNNDRFPDLYISNYGQENRLYRNNRDGTFTDVAPELGVTAPLQSFPVWFWDYNNDGVLDLYVSSWCPDVRYVAAEFLDLPHDAEPPRLYQGDGAGRFRDVAADRKLTAVAQPMGANFGDLDNDGWLDMYLGTGYPEYEALMPNLMYRNAGGARFEDVTMAGGFGHLQKGHGVAFGDLDNDGDQDVYVQMGGAFTGDAFGNVFFENPGFDRHWIGIRLIGRRSNRSAIGARIRVDVRDENGRTRSIYKWVDSGGSFGANPLQQQIGLGTARAIERVEIFWPCTGRTQAVSDLEMDQFIEVTEGVDGYRPRSLKRIRFATGANPAAAQAASVDRPAFLRDASN